MRYFRVHFFIILALSITIQARAKGDIAPIHQQQITHLEYLLAIDRLDFYSDGLADFLDDHQQVDIATAVRNLKPEDFAQEQFSFTELNSPQKWNEMILRVLHRKQPALNSVQLKDIDWNYNFFRNKLMQSFKANPVDFKLDSEWNILPQQPAFQKRSIPKVQGQEILLDAERYISEKTTRALFWDAALTDKNIEFHLGSERDFRNRIIREKREIVAEVKTRAANYNKIYLVYNQQNQKYAYAFTRISGDDRIKHLIAQLRIIKFENKVPLKKDSVTVYGNANDIHREQEQKLLDLFDSLPKADLVVIGQKSAITNVITTAGMMSQIQPDIHQVVGIDKSPLQKISKKVVNQGSYFAVAGKSSEVKSQFESIPTTARDLNYEIFNTEQLSHDVADVLLETQDGKVVRWRLISNMWGDEVIPVARALRRSGHTEVVYIGTAGALLNKGLKVGDVVAPSQTYTQDEKLLTIEKPAYGTDFIHTGKVLGQVKTPFEETQKWYKQWSKKIDIVELETGYLKENLGNQINFQPYLLISDIVGSQDESLAVAAADSSKRKNGQIKLLEDLFIQNKIKSPIANIQMISAEVAVHNMYRKIEKLRPSRDISSKLQLTQLALRLGVMEESDLEKLIKSEPSFDRQYLNAKLTEYSLALEKIAKKVANLSFSITGNEEFLNGTWNPKRKLTLNLSAGQLTAIEANRMYANELIQISDLTHGNLKIEFVDFDAKKTNSGIVFRSQDTRVLEKFYDEALFKKMGLIKEVDNNGGIRLREVIESTRGARCETILL